MGYETTVSIPPVHFQLVYDMESMQTAVVVWLGMTMTAFPSSCAATQKATGMGKASRAVQ